MGGPYIIEIEVDGDMAMFSRPDSGSEMTSYPCPTYSAAKGIFESILFRHQVEVIPLRVDICKPICYMPYTYNYNGHLRKKSSIKKGNPQQVRETVLFDVCFQLTAEVVMNYWVDCNEAHAYEEMFKRRLARGFVRHPPFLGRREMSCGYCGPFRADSQPQEVTQTIGCMLKTVWDKAVDGNSVQPTFYQDARIEKGRLVYA